MKVILLKIIYGNWNTAKIKNMDKKYKSKKLNWINMITKTEN